MSCLPSKRVIILVTETEAKGIAEKPLSWSDYATDENILYFWQSILQGECFILWQHLIYKAFSDEATCHKNKPIPNSNQGYQIQILEIREKIRRVSSKL